MTAAEAEIHMSRFKLLGVHHSRVRGAAGAGPPGPPRTAARQPGAPVAWPTEVAAAPAPYRGAHSR